MKIAYIGNFTQPHCTEVHIASTLEKLGHSVARLQEDEFDDNKLVEIFDCQLLLFTRTWGNYFTLDHLNQVKDKGIPTASYHLDLYIGLSRKYLHLEKSIDEVLQTDPFWQTDFVFTPDGDPDSQKVFEVNNVHHHYMPAGVFEDECQLTIKQAHSYDVLFVGGGARPGEADGYGHPEWPYRNELIGWLMDTYGERFTKFGHPQKTIRNAELNRLYADTKVVVGDSVCLAFNHQYYWSDRVYETIGRGGFLIHPYIKGLDEEFEDGVNIVFYKFGDFQELKQKIDYYLEHDKERELIRQAGYQLVKNNYTYTQRLRTAIDVIFGEKVQGVESQLEVTNLKPSKTNKGQFGQRPAWNKGIKGEEYKAHYKNGIKNLFDGINNADEKHPQWKGDDASYVAKHQWVYRKLGKPQYCEECGTIDAKKFEWANISGEYKRNIYDWKRLCTSCHHKFDNIAAKRWETRKIKNIRLNLGAGQEPTEGWTNVDWLAGEGINVVHDLNQYPYPFADGVADEIKAIDVMEHLPPHNNVKFIEEIHRLLVKGGKALITVPHHQSKNAMIDPTHYRGFDVKSLDYFDPETDFGKWYGYYSDCKFKVQSVRTPNDNVEFRLTKI